MLYKALRAWVDGGPVAKAHLQLLSALARTCRAAVNGLLNSPKEVLRYENTPDDAPPIKPTARR